MTSPHGRWSSTGGAVVLHVVVGLRHLLQAVVDVVHGEGQLTGKLVVRVRR